MVKETEDLDEHRGMAAQKATLLRRAKGAVRADQMALQTRHEELEHFMLAEASQNWNDAVEKARYLLQLFAESPSAEDPRRQKLIHAVLDDFDRLLASDADGQ